MDESLERLRKSFQPRQWFNSDGEPDPFVIADEETFMWVYRGNEENGYLVGFYAPDGTWFTDSEWKTKQEAADRVNYLNGGKR